MNNDDLRPLKKFVLHEQITNVDLGGDASVRDDLMKVRSCVEIQRRNLIFGSRKRPDEPKNEWRRLLAPALIANDMEGVEAIALLWVNLAQKDDWLGTTLTSTLSSEKRMDLMRPAMAALHDVAFSVWEQRTDKPKNKDEQEPAKKRFSHLIEQRKNGGETPIGVKEWCDLGDKIAGLFGGFQEEKTRSISIEVIRDIVTTIPDSRAWAAPILISLLWHHIDSRGSENPAWLATITPIMDLFTDQEAGFFFRKLADLSVLTWNPPVIEQMAQRILVNHPQLSLDEWLLEVPDLSIRCGGLKENGWTDARTKIMTEGYKFSRVYNTLAADRIQKTAQTYNQMVGWLGPDQFENFTPLIEQRLTDIVNHLAVREDPLPALRSALDRLRLASTIKEEYIDPGTPHSIQTDEPPKNKSTRRM